MSFLKQPFDFLIDRDDMIDVTFPGYIMILVVCAVTLFLIIPKGDTVITPVMETTVSETVEMTDPRTVTKGEEVAVISPGTTLRIYAVSGISLWAEDSRGNRGYVPASILGDRYYLADSDNFGDTPYKAGTPVTLTGITGEGHFEVRTDDGMTMEIFNEGSLYPAEALGFPSKGKNEMHISRKKILEIFQPGKTFAEIDGQPLYAQTIRSSGGQLTADFRYTVYDAEAKMIHSGIRAVFSDGVLESWEWGTVKDEEYNLALKAIPWTETLIGLPLIKDLNFKKPVGKTKAKTPEDFDKIDLTYHPNLPGFLSTAINIIIYIVLLAIALYVLLDLLILLPLLHYPLLYIRFIPNIVFKLLAFIMVFVSSALLFMAFGPFLGGNDLGDTGKLWLLILLLLFNLYTSYKYFGFLLYNRCPSCGRMHTLDTTDEGCVTGTSYTDRTTYEVKMLNNREMSRKALHSDHYKNTHIKEVLQCRRCGNKFSHRFVISTKIGSTQHNN